MTASPSGEITPGPSFGPENDGLSSLVVELEVTRTLHGAAEGDLELVVFGASESDLERLRLTDREDEGLYVLRSGSEIAARSDDPQDTQVTGLYRIVNSQGLIVNDDAGNAVLPAREGQDDGTDEVTRTPSAGSYDEAIAAIEEQARWADANREEAAEIRDSTLDQAYGTGESASG